MCGRIPTLRKRLPCIIRRTLTLRLRERAWTMGVNWGHLSLPSVPFRGRLDRLRLCLMIAIREQSRWGRNFRSSHSGRQAATAIDWRTRSPSRTLAPKAPPHHLSSAALLDTPPQPAQSSTLPPRFPEPSPRLAQTTLCGRECTTQKQAVGMQTQQVTTCGAARYTIRMFHKSEPWAGGCSSRAFSPWVSILWAMDGEGDEESGMYLAAVSLGSRDLETAVTIYKGCDVRAGTPGFPSEDETPSPRSLIDRPKIFFPLHTVGSAQSQ